MYPPPWHRRRAKRINANTEKDLESEIKKLLKEKREAVEKAQKLIGELRETKYTVYELADTIAEGKERLGKMRAQECPALKKDVFNHFICHAKRFKHDTYGIRDMWRLHCCFCKLTNEQRKNAILFQRILNGRRE